MNPYDSSEIDNTQRNIIGIETARVITAPNNDSSTSGAHHVEVKPEMFDQPIIADVMIGQTGDAAIPTEGDRVAVGYQTTGRPLILGSRYGPESDIPDYQPGERIIGHPLSDAHVKLASDGTVHIEGDADVVINGGGTRPVTDVETTTDSEGHVTDVSLSRASNVYLPSE